MAELFFLEGDGFMRNIKECVSAFLPLLNIEYEVVLICFYLMIQMISIYVGHFSLRIKKIIRKIKLLGQCCIKRNVI